MKRIVTKNTFYFTKNKKLNNTLYETNKQIKDIEKNKNYELLPKETEILIEFVKKISQMISIQYVYYLNTF